MQHLGFIHRVHSCKGCHIRKHSHEYDKYKYIQTYSLLATKTQYIYNKSIYKCKKLHWRLLLSFHTDQWFGSLFHLGEPQLMMAFTIRTLPWLYWLQPLEGVFLGREKTWCIWAWYRYSDYTYKYARKNIQIYIYINIFSCAPFWWLKPPTTFQNNAFSNKNNSHLGARYMYVVVVTI